MDVASIWRLLMITFILSSTEENPLNKMKVMTLGRNKPKVGEFVKENEYEYPGTDPKGLKAMREMWDKYYECLREKYSNLGQSNSVIPQAVMVFEGSSVRLDCDVCVSPRGGGSVQGVEWLCSTQVSKGTHYVELDEHILLSPEDNTLHMYSLRGDNSGQYMCRTGHTIHALYFLHITNESEPTVMVRPEQARNGLHPESPLTLGPHNLQVLSSWEQWSPCSKCGQVGKRVRIGICTVVLSNSTRTEPPSNNTSENLEEKDLGILRLFKKGLPCRSHLLPHTVRSLLQVRERKSEILVGFCKTQCPQPDVFEVRDEKGNIIEVANNSAGIYSTLQELPLIPPAVERRTIFENTLSNKVIIKCPGNLNSDTPVLWQIASFNINPLMISSQSHGRISIDMMDHLIITRPRVVDSNIYSCWQDGKLAGTTRLVITEKIHMSFNHHTMLLGMVLILGTFTLIFYRVFKGRKRQLAR